MKVPEFLAYSCRLMVGLTMMPGFFQIYNFAQRQAGVWERKNEFDGQGRAKSITMPNKYIVTA